MSTDSAPVARPGRAPSASACDPYRELIAEALSRGRNAMAIRQARKLREITAMVSLRAE